MELFDGYIDKSKDDGGPMLRWLRSQCVEHPASTSKLSLLGCEVRSFRTAALHIYLEENLFGWIFVMSHLFHEHVCAV